jgi:hypothetical protein
MSLVVPFFAQLAIMLHNAIVPIFVSAESEAFV